MANEPIIKEDTLRADFINALFLRPVWRKPLPEEPKPRVKYEHPDYPNGSRVRIKVYFRGDLNGAVGTVDQYWPEASGGPIIGVHVSGEQFDSRPYFFNPYELTLEPEEG